MKTVIVGGVAAGASAAARLRRLREDDEILLLERGPYISFANCGLPYRLGGVIPNREALLVMTPERFTARFRVDVRVNHEAVAVDRTAKTIAVRGPDNAVRTESYDKLLLATGSSPLVPPLPGVDHPRVFRLWTLPDLDRLTAAVDAGAKRALVVGGGFIGLETAENLARRGVAVTVVELLDQILPTMDREMTAPLAAELARLGVGLELGRKLMSFKPVGGGLAAVLDDGRELAADFAVMSVGVRPNNELAKAAGLELGPRGHIVVDESLRTSDPDILAAGDAAEVADPLLGGKTAVPLAGPANKQGRVAADVIAGRAARYRGSYGTAILQLGDLAAAGVGATERRLKAAGMEYRKIYVHPASNASYYPGGAPIHMKLLFAPDGRILGCQAVGTRGVDKRIDVVATAMRAGVDAPGLAELELAYAPPFNAARDPVNVAGMVAGNVLDGDSKAIHADALPAGARLIDVREPAEFAAGTIPGAANIPLGSLRSRLGELDRTMPLVAFCQVGLRGYVAERLLRQHGFDVANLSGGYTTWKLFHPPAAAPVAAPPPVSSASAASPAPAAPTVEVDARGLACPGPVVRLTSAMEGLPPGATLRLLAPSSFEPDLNAWTRTNGHALLSLTRQPDHLEAVVGKAAPGAASPATTAPPAGASAGIVLFSNDLDRTLAAFIIACGMAASGMKTGIFFTFWGLSALRKDPPPSLPKPWTARLFGWMLPRGAKKLALSKMHMAGLGTAMMRRVMKEQNVSTLPELMDQARGLGVKFTACEMAMGVMGLSREELVDVDEVAGVASFVADARAGGPVLFI